MNKKVLIVLDIHGVLCKKTGRKYHDVDNFLNFCYDNFHVGFYSSMYRKNMDKFLTQILTEQQITQTIFIYDRSKCVEASFKINPWDTIKDIDVIKKDYTQYDHIILCDDTYSKVECNPPENYILVDAGDEYHLGKLKIDILNKIN